MSGGTVQLGGHLDYDSFYLLYEWEGGIRLLFVYDAMIRGESCDNQGSFENPNPSIRCPFLLQGGARIIANVQTEDGRTAVFHLDGQAYDLAQGTVFVLRTEDTGATVTQLQRDLSQIDLGDLDQESLQAFLRADQEIQRLMVR